MAVSHEDKLLSEESFPSSNQPTYNWMEVTQDFLSGCKGKIAMTRTISQPFIKIISFRIGVGRTSP